MEPLSTILPFSVNLPFPDLPNFYLIEKIGPETRNEKEIKFLLKVKTITFKSTTYRNIN